jgi:N-acetylmuramoyl-L-alanine amidase
MAYASDFLIGVNNGHGIETAGKRTPLLPAEYKDKVYYKDGHMREWEFNHATAKYLDAELRRIGFRTLMISDTKTDTPLSTRTNLANSRGVDLYLSIHGNANKSVWGDWGGIETFAHPNSKKGQVIAKAVQDEMIKATGLRNRGVKDGSHLWEINKTQMPCALVECGFMDNLTEAKLLMSDAYRRKVAVAIAKGICRGFGVTYKENTTETPTNDNKGDSVAIGTLKVLVDDLWYYNKPDWDAKVGQVDANTILTVVDVLTVNGSKMYKLISGTYITAYEKYVQFTAK